MSTPDAIKLVQIDSLTHQFNKVTAIDNLSLSVSRGERVALLGHNGAGKTTIMKMLTGYIEPSSGQISVDGCDVQQDPLAVQRLLGYLPESLPLYPELTVTDYLVHAARLRELEPMGCVSRAIAATQLEEKALARIDTLSRGYKQRLGVAQAILSRPKFLILDEPSNGLDPNQIQQMRRLIKSLAKEATVILSTHIMQEVNALCDRALILRNGKLVVDEQLSLLQRSNQARLLTRADDMVSAAVRDVAPDAQQTSPGEWLVQLHGESNAAVAELARRLVALDVPLFHLAAEVRDLETIFAEASESDTAVSDTAGDAHAA